MEPQSAALTRSSFRGILYAHIHNAKAPLSTGSAVGYHRPRRSSWYGNACPSAESYAEPRTIVSQKKV